ncbi:type II secretion system protein [Phormidium sp. CLA17]|uniref:pilus assembly FimT family protein n=1 Tax=Leptolyngbya sp. Cla-17 TaxID=2803751 RepID=UPI00149214AA|nr:type II secretion system protein [Leptolyngbya sp. Cla-17]MBM0743868.1 type II secretion system protein [Leptolyngbya sp. Cla-17]
MKASSGKPSILLIQPIKKRESHGFTLLEVSVALGVIGILFAIATPAWSSLLNKQRLNTARNEAFQAMRTAQHKAKLQHVDWQVSFREVNGLVQWAIHPDSTLPSTSLWHSLDSNVRIDQGTTLYFDGTNNIYRLRFTHLGRVSGQLGRITFSSKTDSQTKRCVIVSTLLGTMREGEKSAGENSDKLCN